MINAAPRAVPLEEGAHSKSDWASTPKIYLIGPMRAFAANGENILPKPRRARALLAYLCMANGEIVSRTRLADTIWDRASERQSRLSLRHDLSEISRSQREHAPGLVEIGREHLRLDPAACWIDVFADPDFHHSDRLLDDLDGLSASFDQWLAGERARLEDRLRAGLEAELSRLVEDDSEPQLRAAAARKVINFDSTHESAVRELMRAFVEMGDRPQALREFERCRSSLKSILDLSPSKQTLALYDSVRDLPPKASASAGNAELFSRVPRQPLDSAELSPEQERQSSIAVLAFRNLSPAPGQDQSAEGLVDELIEALARIPSFFVTSRLSTLRFRGEDRRPQELGTALGVRYVISGSIRVVGDRLRLIAELTDTRSGVVLWGTKYDEGCADLLDVQSRLAVDIVRRVAPFLYAAELRRVRAKGPEKLAARDFLLRAQDAMHNRSRITFESSALLLDEAIKRDPYSAPVLAWRAYWHVLRVGQGWSTDPDRDASQADAFAQRAVDCDALEPMALAVQGHIASYLHKDFDAAFQHFETAMRVNPNAAPAWLWSAAAHAWIGNGPRAVEEINRAIALSPYDPLMFAYSANAGMAYLADGKYDRAIECGLRSIGEHHAYTSAYKLLVLATTLAKREREAQIYLRRLLKLEPGLTVERYRQRFPGSETPTGDLYCKVMARAGLPHYE